MELGIFSVLLGFAFGWFWAKTHYKDEAKKDFEYQFNEIAKSDWKDLEEKIEGVKAEYFEKNKSTAEFAPLGRLEKDPIGSWYLHYMKIRRFNSILQSCGWEKKST